MFTEDNAIVHAAAQDRTLMAWERGGTGWEKISELGGRDIQKNYAFWAICQRLVRTTCKAWAFPASECNSCQTEQVDSKTKTKTEWFVLVSSSVRWSTESRWSGKPMNINFSMPIQGSKFRIWAFTSGMVYIILCIYIYINRYVPLYYNGKIYIIYFPIIIQWNIPIYIYFFIYLECMVWGYPESMKTPRHALLVLPVSGRLLGGCHKIAFGVIHWTLSLSPWVILSTCWETFKVPRCLAVA